jgi:hypothetical protein
VADLVGQAQFLQQPEHALRARIVEMVHDEHRESSGVGGSGAA